MTENFKSYYLHRLFKKIINEMDSKKKENVTHLWKAFNNKTDIDITAESWDEITKCCLNRFSKIGLKQFRQHQHKL